MNYVSDMVFSEKDKIMVYYSNEHECITLDYNIGVISISVILDLCAENLIMELVVLLFMWIMVISLLEYSGIIYIK